MKASIQNGEVNLMPEDYWENKMLVAAAETYATRKADQDALSKAYTVEEAAIRLRVCKETVYNLIDEKRIKFSTVGKKGYRITELACREFLGDTLIIGFDTRVEKVNHLKAS